MKKKLKSPRNTAQETQDKPILGLVTTMGDGILTQEAQGQQSLVNSDTLPTKINQSDKEALESFGVKFLGGAEGDDLFQYVELPEGWEKKPANHSMWSDLVDDKGRKRADIFYKAAFYDRRAHMSLSRRFHVLFDYGRFEKENVGVAKVMEGKEVVHITDPIQVDGKERYEVSGEAE